MIRFALVALTGEIVAFVVASVATMLGGLEIDVNSSAGTISSRRDVACPLSVLDAAEGYLEILSSSNVLKSLWLTFCSS